MKELLEVGVNISLEYNAACDALVGKIRDLAVVIKENDQTKSYGCLIWVKKSSGVDSGELTSYLAEQVTTKSHIIKHFKAAGRGAAIALVKYNDPYRNVNNIKRFLSDLAGALGDMSYENCCYKCGKNSDLAIYNNDGAIGQFCSDCGKGDILVRFEGSGSIKAGSAGKRTAPVPAPVTVETVPTPAPVVEEKIAEPVQEEPAPAAVEAPAETIKEAEPVINELLVETAKEETAPAAAEAPTETIKEAEPVINELLVETVKEETAPAAVEAPAETIKEAEPVINELLVETAKEEPVPSDVERSDEGIDAEDARKEFISAMAQAAASVAQGAEKSGADDDLLLDISAKAEEPDDEEREQINTQNDGIDLSGFMVSEEKPEDTYNAPESGMFEAAQHESDEEKRFAAEKEAEQDDAMNDLMFVAGEDNKDNAESAPQETAKSGAGEVAFGMANLDSADNADAADGENITFSRVGQDKSGIDDLMFDGSDAGNSASGSTEEPAFGNANMRDDEDVRVTANEQTKVGEQDTGFEVTEVTPLTLGQGTGEDLVVPTAEDDDVGEDPNIEVTELYDDSNEGEDIDITASSTDFTMPTDTSGGELDANETPLEADGSVPLVNPSSGFADIRPSPVNSENAVKEGDASNYIIATGAEEPMRFDGRPKGYVGGDPRMGDETGHRSRNYNEQSAAASAGVKQRPTVEPHVVEDNTKARTAPQKPLVTDYAAYQKSNGFLGFIASLLFALIGAALWVGIGYIVDGFGISDANTAHLIVSACAFVVTIAAFIGYRIGGDCVDAKGRVISSIITVIVGAVGLCALFVTDEMRTFSKANGYDLSLGSAIDNTVKGLTEAADKTSLFLQIGTASAAVLISLVIAVIIAKKRND